MLGTVAETATKRVLVPSVFMRLTTTSRTAPRTSAPTVCTSSTLQGRASALTPMSGKREGQGERTPTHQKSLSWPSVEPWSCHLRVMASHFSGVVTMMRALAKSRHAEVDVSESPVSSCTAQPRPCSNLRFQSSVRSEQSDLVGACERGGVARSERVWV